MWEKVLGVTVAIIILTIVLSNLMFLDDFNKKIEPMNLWNTITKDTRLRDFLLSIFLVILLEFLLKKFLTSNNSWIELSTTFSTIFKNFISTKDLLTIYLGLVTFLFSIYVYIIGIENNFKKSILIYLIGEGNILYLSTSVLFLFLFNINPIFTFILILLTFYELYKMIDLIFLVINETKFQKEFDNIIKRFKYSDETDGLTNLYSEIKKKLYSSLMKKDYLTSQEIFDFYYKILIYPVIQRDNNFPEDTFTKEDEEKYNNFTPLIKSYNDDPDSTKRIKSSKRTTFETDTNEQRSAVEHLRKLFNLLLQEPNEQFYNQLCLFSYQLGPYYLKKYAKEKEYADNIVDNDSKKKYADNIANNTLEIGKVYYNILDIKYEYLVVTNKGKKEISNLIDYNFFSGYTYLGFKREEQLIVIYKSLLILFDKVIKENDFETFQKIKPILQDENSNNIIKNYSSIILIALLSDNKYEKWRQKLYFFFKFLEINELEEIFKRNYELDYKFKTSDFTNTPFDIKGMSIGKSLGTRDVILTLLNKNPNNLSFEFILENYEALENKVYSLKSNKIKSQLDELKSEIDLKKAEKISKNILKESDIEEFYKKNYKFESRCMSFILEQLSNNKENRSPEHQSEEIWSTETKGYNVISRNDVVLNKSISFQYINMIEEYFLIKECKSNITGSIEFSKIDKTKQWCLIISLNDYNKYIEEEVISLSNVKVSIISRGKIYNSN